MNGYVNPFIVWKQQFTKRCAGCKHLDIDTIRKGREIEGMCTMSQGSVFIGKNSFTNSVDIKTGQKMQTESRSVRNALELFVVIKTHQLGVIALHSLQQVIEAFKDQGHLFNWSEIYFVLKGRRAFSLKLYKLFIKVISILKSKKIS